MTAAALATGNTVVLKPAEQAPGCGLRVVEALRAGGVPAGAIALLPGEGEAGAALAAPPRRRDDRLHRLGRRRPRAPAHGGRGARRARASSSASSPRWAARTASSSTPTPTSTRRSRRSSSRPSATPGRSARRRRACSSTRRCTTRSSSGSPGAVAGLQVGPADDFAHRRAAGHRARGAGARAPLRRRSPPRDGRDRRRRMSDAAAREGWYVAPVVATGLPPDSPRPARRDLRPAARRSSPVRDVDEACDRIDALPVALTGGLFSRNPRTVAARHRPLAGRQPLRQPLDDRRDGRPPAVRRQPPVGHRHEGRRRRLPAALRRAARRDREHGAPRARRLATPASRPGHVRCVHSPPPGCGLSVYGLT